MTPAIEPPVNSPQPIVKQFQSVKPPIRVALVGAGFIADYHLEILRNIPEVEVVGICDPNAARRTAVAKRWKIPVHTDSVPELLSQAMPVAVHVLVPPSLHFDVSRQILDLGVHVLLEKPMALSEDDAESLAQIAAARGVRLAVNHNWVYQPLFRRALADVAALKIGPVRHVISSNSLPLFQLSAGLHDHWMFASPTNVLFEQAPHPLSQICALVGDIHKIRTACSGVRTLRGGRSFYPTWQFTIDGEHATAQLFMAFEGAIADAQLHIIGQDGTIHIDQLANCYTLDRRTSYAPPLDSFFRATHHAFDYARGALRQFAGYGSSLFKLAGRQDVYYLGMKNSVVAFYRDLLQGRSENESLENGLQTIVAIQQVVDHTQQVLSSSEHAQPAPAWVSDSSPNRRQAASAGKVLVIGAGGFIGRRMLRGLVAAGYDVRAMIRNPTKIADLAATCSFEVVRGDVEDRAAVDSAICGCSSVINLVAGAPTDWPGHERLFIEGLRNVAEAGRQQGVERFLHTSSIAALDLSKAGDVITERAATDSRVDERGFYAKAKILGEALLDEMGTKYRFPCTIFRPGIVVGLGTPPQHLGVGEWPSDILCIRWGRDLACGLPFVLVDDVVQAYLKALALPPDQIAGRKFNLVGDVQLSAQQYIDVLRDETSRDFQVRPHSVAAWALAESTKYAIKFVARKTDNVRLTWHELAYRTAAARLDCSETKRSLNWQPVADRDEFIEHGIRAAIRGEQFP